MTTTFHIKSGQLLSFVTAFMLGLIAYLLLHPLRLWQEEIEHSNTLTLILSFGVFLCSYSSLLNLVIRRRYTVIILRSTTYTILVFLTSMIIYIITSHYYNENVYTLIANLYSTFMLTSFMPGFMVIKLLDDDLRLLDACILAVPLSMAITTFIGFPFLLTRIENNQLFIPLIMILLNLFLLFLYIISHRKDVAEKVDLLELIFVLGLLLLISTGTLSLCLKLSPLSQTHSSMYNHYRNALYAVNGEWNFVRGADRESYYPWFFSVFLATLFSTSSVPAMILFKGLSIFTPMTILSYYLALKMFLNNEKAAMIATLLLITSGFGGIMVIASIPLLQPSSINSWVNLIRSISEKIKPYTFSHVFMDVHPTIIAWSMFYQSLYMIRSETINNRLRNVFLTISFLVMYLGHVTPLVIFAIASFLFSIIYRKNMKNIFMLMLGSLVIVIFFDYLIPTHIYTHEYIGPFIFSITVCLVYIFLPSKLHSYICEIYNKLISTIFNKHLLRTFFPLYLMLIGIYIYMLPSINVYTPIDRGHVHAQGAWIIPLYMNVTIFGFSLLTAILGLYLYGKDILQNKDYILFLTIFIFSIIFQQILSFIHATTPPSIYTALQSLLYYSFLAFLYNITETFNGYIAISIPPIGAYLIYRLREYNKVSSIVLYVTSLMLGFPTYLYDVVWLGSLYHLPDI